MKMLGQFCRMVLALPLVFPVTDRIWLDPWNNFIDYGSFRCS